MQMGFQSLSIDDFDISFSLNKDYQLMTSPYDSHLSAVNRISRYLSGIITRGLTFTLASLPQKIPLRAYSDSD